MADITVSELVDVLEVRIALEALAVKQACRNHTKDQIDRLGRAAADFRRALYGTDVLAYAQADEEFHEVIYEMTGNRRLVQILNNLREQMYRYRMEYLKDRTSHPQLVHEHEAILRALDGRDETAAVELLTLHVERQKEYIIERISHKE